MSKEPHVENEQFEIRLNLSEDGKSIIDDSGNEIARFSEDFIVNNENKLFERPGHFVCEKVCNLWDSNGKCIRWANSCTWLWD
jgi:hypothetical protein